MDETTNPYEPLKEDVIADWLGSLDVSENTKRHYKQAMKSFLEYVRISGLDFDNLEGKHVNDYKSYLLHELGRAPAGVSLYLSGIRSYYRFAEDQGLKDITRNVHGVPAGKGFKKAALTPDEATRLLKSIVRVTLTGKRDFAMVNLMLRTGLRDIEVSRASVGDVRRKRNVPVLYVRGKGHAESDEYVVLPECVHSPIKDYLTARRKSGEILFDDAPLFASESNRNKGGRMNPLSISQIIKAALRKADIDDCHHTAHSLRHTAITFALMGGATERQVQKMARHADFNTTLIYAHDLDRIEHAAEYSVESVLPPITS